MEILAAVTYENGLFDARGHEDLTLIVTINRRVGLSLSQGRGHGDEFCSVAMRI